MRIGMALEEIFNPRMKQSGAAHKLFKTLSNTYIQGVFDSMDESEDRAEAPSEPEMQAIGGKTND